MQCVQTWNLSLSQELGKKLEEVHFLVHGKTAHYLYTKPIHESQIPHWNKQTVAMKDDLSKAIFMPGMEKTLNHILKTTVDFAYDTADNCQEFADIIDKNLSNDCELEK